MERRGLTWHEGKWLTGKQLLKLVEETRQHRKAMTLEVSIRAKFINFMHLEDEFTAWRVTNRMEAA